MKRRYFFLSAMLLPFFSCGFNQSLVPFATPGYAEPEFRIQQIIKVPGCPDAYSPEWSEDGRYLFYTCLDDEEKIKIVAIEFRDSVLSSPIAQDNLHLVSPSQKMQMKKKKRSCHAPYPEEKISPDGKNLVFVGLQRRVRNLFLKNLLSNQFHPLTGWPFDTFKPSWSSDGQYIASYTNFHPNAIEDRHSLLLLPADERTRYAAMALVEHVAIADVWVDEAGPQFWRQHLFAVRRFAQGDFLTVLNLENKKVFFLDTGHRENRNVRISRDGVLAIEIMDGSRSQIYIATLHE